MNALTAQTLQSLRTQLARQIKSGSKLPVIQRQIESLKRQIAIIKASEAGETRPEIERAMSIIG